ncbi:hypothetical protein AAFF_G00043040 [Aldrovandia affinis]|uniref:Uncharacterized protein n=1 Tax=Aldrovandia affinis TaxID=143900 RepID=A0AAD7S2C8_9TELE|nr:hypothetical protein AAFF_G00043040 [Aldrovandia affinis]
MRPRRTSQRRTLTSTWVPRRLRRRPWPSSHSSESSRRRNLISPRANRAALPPTARGRCGGSVLHVTVITPYGLKGGWGDRETSWCPVYH